MSQSDADLLERLNDVIIKAQTAGANAADLVYAEGTSVTMSIVLVNLKTWTGQRASTWAFVF